MKIASIQLLNQSLFFKVYSSMSYGHVDSKAERPRDL